MEAESEVQNAVPIAVPIKYGQDRRICVRANMDQDAKMWQEHIDVSKLLRMEMAMAIHIA